MPRQGLGFWVNIACSWVIWAASSQYAKERFAPFLPHRLGCARMDPFSCLFCCWLSMMAHDFQVLQVGWSHPQLYTQSRWNSMAWKGPPGNSAFDVPFFFWVSCCSSRGHPSTFTIMIFSGHCKFIHVHPFFQLCTLHSSPFSSCEWIGLREHLNRKPWIFP